MTKVNIQQIIAKVDSLPELPQIAMRVSSMMQDENISADNLSEVIRLDPSLTGQVLKLCNSAAYGFSRRIATVKEAVAILGFKVLHSMVYTIISKAALDKPVPGYSLKEGDLWQNALTCAVYAKHIARQYTFRDPELAFTGALLRDIGKIVLGEFVGANYAAIEQAALSQQVDFVEAEQAVLGFNHMVVGQRIAERWNLPQHLTLVIRHHHKPLQIPVGIDADMTKLISIVHLADAMTMMIGSGVGGDGMMYSLDIEALNKNGIHLDEASLERLMSELVELNAVVKDIVKSFQP